MDRIKAYKIIKKLRLLLSCYDHNDHYKICMVYFDTYHKKLSPAYKGYILHKLKLL